MDLLHEKTHVLAKYHSYEFYGCMGFVAVFVMGVVAQANDIPVLSDIPCVVYLIACLAIVLLMLIIRMKALRIEAQELVPSQDDLSSGWKTQK